MDTNCMLTGLEKEGSEGLNPRDLECGAQGNRNLWGTLAVNWSTQAVEASVLRKLEEGPGTRRTASGHGKTLESSHLN